MKYIIVTNDIAEDSLFGPEEPPAEYSTEELQAALGLKLEDMYPDVEIQVLDGDGETKVDVDGDDWEVESQVMEAINLTWQKWIDQF